MVQKYPVGLQDFSELRLGGYVYVDKTAYIHRLVNQGKYYFLSRPRRFGKSLFVSTMDYLFKGQKELFEGLYITDKWDWTKTNPIIKISFASISHKEKGLWSAINDQLNNIGEEYGITFGETTISAKFKELIEKLSTQHGKVVILIDEYDKPIIDYLGIDEAAMVVAKKNRDVLKSFYSILKDADPYLKLVFITGVSKFSKVSIFSDLNNLNDLTLDGQYSGICGITQSELETTFTEEIALLGSEAIKRWYNGYSWKGTESVYNPFSLLNFFSKNGDFQNYWFETATPTFLINLTQKKYLYNFENQRITPSQLSAYSLENLQILPLMFQTGYLTIKNFDEEGNIYTLDYPNLEVRRSYLESLADAYIQSEQDQSGVLVYDIRQALMTCDMAKLERLINTLFKSIPYTLWQNENEHFYHAILHLSFRLLNIYVESEVQSSDGRLDALVRLDKFVYCFEFKLDGSAEAALQQIKDKGYLVPYQNQGKTCIGIGLNFSSQNKKVEKILWEEIQVN